MTILTIIAAAAMFSVGSVLIILGIMMLGWVFLDAFGRFFNIT